MPELPEVETTRCGIAPHVVGAMITGVVVREPRLRWRVPAALARESPGQRILAVARRAKYLLFPTDAGTLIVHLGMSGRLLLVPADTPAEKFDHVDIALDTGDCLRLRDPRRFGSVLWTRATPERHPLLVNLGPEPFEADFNTDYLYRTTRTRRRAIRDVLLDGRIVAGVGNIYANEALFEAGIRPGRAAGRLTRADCANLIRRLRATLKRALKAGGTSFRDYRNSRGEPGYFQVMLKVYGRPGEPCRACGSGIRTRRLGQRTAFYCANCQT